MEIEINRKNGWGKNEVMLVFHKCFAIAVAKYAKELNVNLT